MTVWRDATGERGTGLTAVYNMRRHGETMATVVVLPSGRCIVSWPTSTIVYDSEQAARDVHIKHMGGRGEETVFMPVTATGPDFMRAVTDCYQDRCENCWFASIDGKDGTLRAPDYAEVPEDYMRGYAAMAAAQFGEGWREFAERRISDGLGRG